MAIEARNRSMERGVAARNERLSQSIKVNYRPLGTSPHQLADRIHTAQEPSASAALQANELHFKNGTVQIDIDGNGVVVKNVSNGKSVTITPSSITHDMTIQTISVCVGGVSKSMDILASAAY